MRIARDLIVTLRIKLRCFGVSIEGPADTYPDNEVVYKNITFPESILYKKHNSINFHICREVVAAKIIMRCAKEDTLTNLADALTKLQTFDRKRHLLGYLFWDY